MKKWLTRIGITLLVIFVLLQLIPVSRTNPPVRREVKWDSSLTRQLAQRACFDCHSNETVWPWYAYVAPISLRVADHVNEGRNKLNFSAWDQPNEDLKKIKEEIEEGGMPLSDYLLMHPGAKLTDAEKRALIEGLTATLTNDPPIEHEGERPGGK
jgi:hypothetical protein